MDIQDYLIMECLNDQQLVVNAQKLLTSNKKNGEPFVMVPATMLEALIEKAVRPHD